MSPSPARERAYFYSIALITSLMMASSLSPVTHILLAYPFLYLMSTYSSASAPLYTRWSISRFSTPSSSIPSQVTKRLLFTVSLLSRSIFRFHTFFEVFQFIHDIVVAHKILAIVIACKNSFVYKAVHPNSNITVPAVIVYNDVPCRCIRYTQCKVNNFLCFIHVNHLANYKI